MVFMVSPFKELFRGDKRQRDDCSYKKKFTKTDTFFGGQYIMLLKKFQLCHGGRLTLLFPECHAKQPVWSSNEKQCYEYFVQGMIEFARSFGCHAFGALSCSKSIGWGCPLFNLQWLHSNDDFN